MNRLLGGLFETVHVLGMVLLFTAAAALTALTFPALVDQAGLTLESGGRLFDRIEGLVWLRGSWVAGATLLAALLAPYVRGDDAKAVSWTRILLGGAAVVCVVWLWRSDAQPGLLPGDVETHADLARSLPQRTLSFTPWTALLACASLDLVLAAFQVNGNKSKKKGH